MQAHRIHKGGIPRDKSGVPLNTSRGYTACGYLNAAYTSSTDERSGGDKRHAIPGLPGRARGLSPYLSSSPEGTFNRPRGSRRRRREA
jgi:hypothetical protein